MKNLFLAVTAFFCICSAYCADNPNDNYLLNRINDSLVAGVPSSGTVTVAGSALTPTTTAKVASGTIAAGCKQITFIASSDFSGTILTNLPLAASAGLTITAPVGSTIGAIAFTRSAGTLYTVELR